MRLDGSHVIHRSRQEVWDALQDPVVLVATIPGCLELRQDGPDTYRARVRAGIASLTGIYDGHVAIRDQEPPSRYVLRASGQGGPGTIDATVTVRLSDVDGGTQVDYDADTVVGGAIAGIGQRVVAGVAKRNATEFFAAVDRYLTGQPAPQAGLAGPGAPAAEGVYRAPAPAAAGIDLRALLLAAATGAAIALLGVVVGRRSIRRHAAG